MTTGLRSVTVRAPARLHLGFLDLSGSMGRRFGSVGLTLDRLGVALTAERAPSFSVSGPLAQRAERLRTLCSSHRLPETCRIAIHGAIPEHVGLGSGTQLAIAVGVALSHLFGLDLPVRDVAALYDRGQRSGIGVGAFEQGGFLVDGGKGAHDEPPRIVSRIEFPSAWRVLLVFDQTAQGLHGDQEVAAFRALPTFPESASAHLCRLMLMQGLPALLEADLAEFSGAVGELQRVIGDYFSPAQGGRFASPAWPRSSPGSSATAWPGWGRARGVPPGSRSWQRKRAAELARAAQSRWGGTGPLQFTVCGARNRGGEVELAAAATRAKAEASAHPFKADHGKAVHPAFVHADGSGQSVRRQHGLRRRLRCRRSLHQVALDQVAALTQDAIFSRGPKGAKRTGIFIGGRDNGLAADMLDAARKAMVPPFEVSVFVDPSGAFTTAAAMVAAVEKQLKKSHGTNLKGKTVMIFGGSGPVGAAAAVLASQAGAKVGIVGREDTSRARSTADDCERRYGTSVEPVEANTESLKVTMMQKADVALATAKAGYRVVTKGVACRRPEAAGGRGRERRAALGHRGTSMPWTTASRCRRSRETQWASVRWRSATSSTRRSAACSKPCSKRTRRSIWICGMPSRKRANMPASSDQSPLLVVSASGRALARRRRRRLAGRGARPVQRHGPSRAGAGEPQRGGPQWRIRCATTACRSAGHVSGGSLQRVGLWIRIRRPHQVARATGARTHLVRQCP